MTQAEIEFLVQRWPQVLKASKREIAETLVQRLGIAIRTLEAIKAGADRPAVLADGVLQVIDPQR